MASGAVSKGTAPGTGTITITKTGQSIAAGSTVLVGVSASADPDGVTCLGANMFPIVAIGFGTGFAFWIFKLENCAGGTGDIVADFSSNGPIDHGVIAVVEVTGVVAAAVDRFASAAGSSTSANSGATMTTSQGEEMVVEFVASRGPVGDSVTFTDGSTQLNADGTNDTPATNNARIASAYRHVSAAAAYSATATLAPSRGWAAAIVTLIDSVVAPVTNAKLKFSVQVGGPGAKVTVGAPAGAVALTGPMKQTLTLGEG